MNETDALAAFAALSNVTRLRILKDLVRAGPTGRTAGQVAVDVGASPSRASFHLSALVKARLISSEQSAREVIYRAEFDEIGAFVRYFLEDCCSDDARVRACCVGAGKC